ncbi:hypothetical protein FXO38_08055 [Capsicum annuum]|nr:hypothetical protein FXO38_08055 [Capsicum annuum]
MLAMQRNHVRIKSINQVACQELLSWCASYLFNVQSSLSKRSSEVAGIDDIFAELLGLISGNHENNNHNGFSKIVKVQENGGTYSSEIPLLGEVEMQQTDSSSFMRGLPENYSPQISGKICCMKWLLSVNTTCLVHLEGIEGKLDSGNKFVEKRAIEFILLQSPI